MTEKIDSIEVRKPWYIAKAFFERDGEDEEIQSNMEERQTTISKKEAALLEETNSNDSTKSEVRMMKEYRLYEVEEAIAEMDTLDVEDDIAETDEDMQLVISGWYVIIPELNLYLREGVVCIWDEEEEMSEILRQYFINHPQSIDKYTFLQNSSFTHWVKEKCSKMC